MIRAPILISRSCKVVNSRAPAAEEWGGTEITFRLEWRDGQTIVLFKHADWREPVEFMHHCSTKWATFLLSLRDYVEQGESRPELTNRPQYPEAGQEIGDCIPLGRF